MHKLPKLFFAIPTQFVYVSACSLFFLAFSVVYHPFDMPEFLDMGRGLYAFNLAIILAITVVALAVSRTVFHLLGKSGGFTWALYVAWCIGECLMLAIFISLYLTLMLKGKYTYFTVLFSYCLGFVYLIMIYPYLVVTLSYAISARKEADKAANGVDESLIRFYDEYKNPKLMIAASAVLYIKAEENYVNIWYLDGDKPGKYTLRASMTSLESTAEKHKLVRCQRSYYVNPLHVTVLRKENGWVYADLDKEGLPSIPVSKRYYDKLAELL